MMRLFLILTMSCLATHIAAAEVEEPQAPASPRDIEIEMRMDEARAQLDAAAQRLAEVSREAFEIDFVERSKKPVIGVLLDGYGDDTGLLLEGVTPDGGSNMSCQATHG